MLAALYLIFNEGYLASGPESEAVREDLCAEAVRLTRVVRELIADPALPSGPDLMPEVDGLLALMLLTDARRPARVRDGVLVVLSDQDRSLWDAGKIDEGHAIVRRCLAANRPGPYQLQAAVNAVHTDALDVSMTDWSQIVQLYDQLLAVAGTPIVALNRAVALAELDGPEVALAIVDRLELSTYHAWHATRADLLRRLGQSDDARSAYDAAIELAGNSAETSLADQPPRHPLTSWVPSEQEESPRARGLHVRHDGSRLGPVHRVAR